MTRTASGLAPTPGARSPSAFGAYQLVCTRLGAHVLYGLCRHRAQSNRSNRLAYTVLGDLTVPSGVEIERKFLVEELPIGLSAYPCEEIEQGYLALDGDVEVRIRRCGHLAFLTIKSGAARVRLEEELEIETRRFDALWPLTQGRRVEKTRYVIAAAGGVRIELDVYHGQLNGLLTAAVELVDLGYSADGRSRAPRQWPGPPQS